MNGDQPTAWRNRIVRSGDAALSEITPNSANWRTHPQAQKAALSGVLDSVGYVQQVVINERSGRLVDGHLRIALAEQHGESSVPAVWVDLDDDEERLILATLDPLGALAETDAAQLSALLASVTTSDDALAAMLETLAARSGLLPPIDPSVEWQGMPVFEQDEVSDKYKSVTVHFEDAEGYAAFAALLNQNLTPETVFIWYPYKPTHGVAGSMKGYRAEDEA